MTRSILFAALRRGKSLAAACLAAVAVCATKRVASLPPIPEASRDWQLWPTLYGEPVRSMCLWLPLPRPEHAGHMEYG